MVMKLLGGFDLFVGFVVLIYGFFISFWNIHIFPGVFITILGIILFAKGLIFLIGLDVASFIDVVAGILVITSSSYKLPFVLFVIIAVFLIQKGVFSFLD